MAKNLTEIRSLARSYSRSALKVLKGIAENDRASAVARVQAASAILDRGFGKPSQPISGPDGGPIQINISLDDGNL